MTLPANFYIPRTAKEPAFTCRLCGETVRGEASFGRHMKNCSDDREEQMREHSRERNPWLWDTQNGSDTELREYVQRTGKLS